MKAKRRSGLLGLMLLVVCLLAAACSSGGAATSKDGSKSKDDGLSTTVFEANVNGVETEMTYTHKGDKVVKQETHSVIQYESLGVSSKEEAEEMFSFVAEEYDIDGVTYEVDYQEEEMTESVTVDYEKADIQEVMSLMGTLNDQEEEGQKVKYISMKQSKELLLEQGYTEKK
ncbi:YehR family protein [Enterococcus sp. BWM-S5]|uniref:YehR family protein n=1 Tax=Enterococcus larvae TaxID=2794352 RepID=A0ABS4CIX2_9ENTE|nr:YehR family protein [Enterococcus larvae]MBP1046578.1 YehR family protein [Enterococcus larvae]